MIRVNRNCVTVLTATSIEDALWTMYFEVLSSLLFDAKGLFICDYWLQLYHRSDAKFCGQWRDSCKAFLKKSRSANVAFAHMKLDL